MKIWLLNPPYPELVIREGRCEQRANLLHTSYPPLTLVYLGSILKQKFDVKIIDCIAYDINLRKLGGTYKKEKPNKIFLSVSTPTIDYDLKVIDYLNKINNSEFIIFGFHATYFSKELSKYKYIKVIKGEPEKYATELIGKKHNFNELPFPSWDMVDISKYKMPLINENFVLVKSQKGCPYSCTFCVTPYYSNGKVDLRNINSVLNELKYIKKLGINNVIFFADTFTVNKEWVKKLCNGIVKENLKIKWVCNSRVDTIDYETLKIMKQAGLWLISFGIESGDQKILDNCKKRIKLSELEIINKANSLGLLTFGHFIFGLPGETKETIKKTIDLSKSLNLDFSAFYIATPFPGSELYEQVKNNIKTEDWSKFEYSTQVLDGAINLEAWQNKAYKEFYFNNKAKRIGKIIKTVGLKNTLNILSTAMKTYFRIIKK